MWAISSSMIIGMFSIIRLCRVSVRIRIRVVSVGFDFVEWGISGAFMTFVYWTDGRFYFDTR